MGKSNKNINNDKLVKIIKTLAKNNKLEHVTNVIDKVSIKEFEQVREIVPIEKWINDQYYCGRDCVEKLYPFWKDLICDIFKDGKQNYTQVVLTGGIGCRPINDTLYETSEGLLHLNEIQDYLNNDVKVYINTEDGVEQIIATHIIGEKEIITLTLNDGTVFTGSSDHLLKIFDGNEIKFKKLSEISHTDKIIKLQPNTVLSDNKYTYIHVINKSYSNDLVGDIEVAGSHTYISDGGLINHNTGKSTCGLYIVLRKLYELSCYENVAGLFGLMSNSMTAFLYFSLTKYQAERSGFAQLRSIVDSIPYFKEYFKRNQYRNSTLDFPENIRIFYGSSTGDMIGLNCISAIIDEANFFGDSSGSEVDLGSVEELYNAVLSRTTSRFVGNGVNSSLNLVISSSTFKTSMTSKLYEKSLTDHSIKYARTRLWDIKPKGTYSDNTFFVFAGNDKFDPFIIENTSDLSVKLGISLDPSLSIKEAIARLSQEYRNLIDEVPIDFYPNYSNNVIQALQDFSGMSVSSTGKLFTSRSVFESCIDESIKPLFTKHEFTVETMNDDPSNCIQYYLNGIEFPHKECPRYLHIDIGVSNDAYGLACCYKNGSKVVDGVEVPEFYYDFTLRIVPPPAPKRVSISRCHEFIKYMRDELGLTIYLVSFDQFQSESSRQYLNEQNIKTVYQSVDKTDTQYLFFVDCLYKNCVHFSREFADSIHKELFDLIWYRSKHKVDHPGTTKTNGMKDRCDAVVGALYNAYTTKETFANPNDILNLGIFNSDSNGYLDVDDTISELAPGIKKVSLDDIDNTAFNSYFDI